MSLGVIGGSIRALSTHFALSLSTNLAAIVFSIPILMLAMVMAYVGNSLRVIPLAVALMVAVLPNPAVAGVQSLARDLAHHDVVTLGGTWPDLREFWRPALKVWLVSVGASVVIIANLAFYGHAASTPGSSFHAIATPLLIFWLAVLVIWLTMHLYLYPLLMAQASPRMMQAYRNAGLITVRKPLFSILVTFVWLLILVISSTTGFVVLLGLALGAMIQQFAFVKILPSVEAV
ncbi:MAG: hypothetical protein ACRDFX_13190 [Chloroflexota bacterium]